MNKTTIKNLKHHSARSGLITLVGQLSKLILNIISIAILSRILSPKDFGLVAMVAVVMSFISIFKDLGLSMATIQKTDITSPQVSALFWVGLSLSFVLAGTTFFIAPAIADFYKEPHLILVTELLSVTFIFSGLGAQQDALLRREMRLTAITFIDLFSMVIGVVTAVVCALNGMGYWALVWMQIVSSATNAIGLWLASRWIPSWSFIGTGIRPMLFFGGHLTIFGFFNFFSRNLDNFLIGRYCGAKDLGLYSRAYSLILLPITQITGPITSIAIPVLSHLKEQPERYRRYYLKGIRVIAYASFLMITSLLVLSSEIFQLVLGDQWVEAVPIFRVLAIASFFQPIGSTVGWLYISLGQSKRMAFWGIITSPLVMLSFVVGIYWGAIGVAIAYAICSTLLIYPQIIFATKKSPISQFDVYRVISRPFLLSIFFGFFIASFNHFINVDSLFLNIVYSLSGGLFMLGIVAWGWRAVRIDFFEMFDDFHHALKKAPPEVIS